MADITFLSPATEEIILAAHIEVLSRAVGGTGVVEGNAMSPNGMDIDVDAGAIKIFGVGQDVDADSDTVGASDPVLDRIDLVTRDSAGDVVVLPGTPAEVVDPKGLSDWHQFTSPVPPSAIPADSVILGAVHVAAAATSLGIGDIWEFAGRVPANVDLPLVTEIGDPGSDENVVSEKAIRTAVDALMPVSYLTTTIADPGSDAKVPSEKAVRSGLTARISTANIATSIDSPGVDTKVPSEKAVRTELDLRPLLSLLTSRGDIVYRNDTTWARLAKGPQYSVLSMGANDPAWSTVTALLDAVLGSTANSVASRGADSWGVVTPTEQTVLGRITGGSLAALSVAQLQTLVFGAALPENVAMILDPALSADGKYSGIVETGTAGAALAFGDVIYQAVADDRWELAKADAAATSAHRLGICVKAAAGDGSATTILLVGKVRADAAFPTFTKYAPVYISSATAGDLSSTAPSKATGHIVRCVGWAISGDELWFQPDGTWLEYV